ncbi:MAG: hypothetical protein H7X86_11870 [Gorillibacterium sp.]|nr:hypothetical protein [Gorillibacterium sp.]
MDLADMLSYADIQDLSGIARNYEIACNTHSKKELIQSILATIWRNDLLREEVGRMEWGEIRFLNSLLFDRRDSFSLEELTARVKLGIFDAEEKKAVNPRDLIVRFKRRGWLFNGHSHNNKYLFLIPGDLKTRFCQAISCRFSAELITVSDAPAVYRDEGELFVDDLLQFLRFVHTNELPLSAEGYLYKKSMQQLSEEFSVVEGPLPKTAWRFGYGRRFREYPTRFSFMYDYCFYNGFIDEQPGKLLLTEQGKSRLQENRKEDIRQVYRFWLRLYKGPIPNLQSILHWIDLLATSWTSIQSLRLVIRNLIKPFYYDSADSVFEERIIPMMVHLGLVRIGEQPQYGTLLRMTRSGSHMIRGIYVPEEERIILPD